MSTRGFVGFVVDDTEKIAYNHFDSYPDGLGCVVLRWAQANAHELHCDLHRGVSGRSVDLARKLRVVDAQSQPTDEDIEQLKPWTNAEVGGRKDRPDWYQLLRETQGDPGAILAAGVIGDASEFPLDSLFAEWGYLVDLDAQTLDVYRGFQKRQHDQGRFAGRGEPLRSVSGNDYYPCALIASWPLSALPTAEEFVSELEGDR